MVTWTNINLGSEDGDTLNLQGGTSWTSRGRTVSTIQRGESYTFTMGDTLYHMVGLGQDPYTGLGYETIEHGLYQTANGNIDIYENGTEVYSNNPTHDSNTIFKIEITSAGAIKYFIDDTFYYASTTVASTSDEFYLHVTSFNASTTSLITSAPPPETEEQAPHLMDHLIYLKTRPIP